MWDPEPDAPAPADSSSKAWVNFAVAETAQKAKDVKDKVVVRFILTTCEDDNQSAYDSAKKKLNHHWWQIF